MWSYICIRILYASWEIWGQEQNSRLFKNLIKLQEKALRIINFKNVNENENPLFKENQILKISDFIAYKSVLFVKKSLKKENLYLMTSLPNTNRDYITRAGSKNILETPPSQSTQ